MSNAMILFGAISCSACVGPKEMPDSTEPTPAGPVALASEYQLQSQFSLTAGSVAPEPGYKLLADLDKDPGALLVSVADAAGVLAAELLFDALPDSISGRVSGWMSDAIDSSQEVQTLIAWSRTVLAEMQLQSNLSLGPANLEGKTSGTHDLQSLTFQIDGREFEQSLPAIAGLPGAGHAVVELQVVGDELRFGEQRFGLLFGEAAYQAFENAVSARYGTSLRSVLGQAIDCPGMAEEVAAKCVLGVCVGHKTELASLCEAGVDEIVAAIRGQFAAFDAELLQLRSGTASLNGSELEQGTWDAVGEFGLGLRDLPASFTGQGP